MDSSTQPKLELPGVTHSEGSFVNPRNHRIFTQQWVTDNAVATVVLVHGLGEHSGRYLPIIEHLCKHKYSIFAMDHESHGRSEGQKEYVDSLQHLVDDVVTYATSVHAQFSSLPKFILGHSMGGCISLTVGVQHPNLFDYWAISSPVTSRPPSVNALLGFGAKVMASIAPRSRPAPLNIKTLCRDANVIQEYNADPLVWHQNLAAKFGYDILNAGSKLLESAPQFNKPLLLIQGDADEIVNPKGTAQFFDASTSPDKTFISFKGLYHELFNEPEKESIYPIVSDWMNARVALNTGSNLVVNSRFEAIYNEGTMTMNPL